MRPELWFSITTSVQFIALLPVGVVLGFLTRTTEFIRPSGLYPSIAVFWSFLFVVRAAEGHVNWQSSVGTLLLNVAFVMALTVGTNLRERVDG